MADNTLKVRLQSAYKTSADWDTLNPVLKNGEAGYVSSPENMYGWYKIGNGTSTWQQLPWANAAKAQHATSAATLDNTEFVEDNEPYLFRTTPREAGDRVYEDAIVGGSVAWNQLEPLDASKYVKNNVTLTLSNGEYALTKTTSETTQKCAYFNVPSNHVFYYSGKVKSVTGTFMRIGFIDGNFSNTNSIEGSSSGEYVSGARIYKTGNGEKFAIRMNNSSTGDAGYAKDINVIDLTLALGSTIADYAYTLETSEAGSGIAWLKSQGFFTKGYYAYNAGGIESVKTSAKKVVGFNQWDEQWEVGDITESGVNTPGSNNIRSKDYIPIFPNTQYYLHIGSDVNMRYYFYDENKTCINNRGGYKYADGKNTTTTSPDNARYMRFKMFQAYGTTYNNDICINIHWDGEKDGEYEPYVEHTYPLDSDLELRGIPTLVDGKIKYDGDLYASDGSVTRRFGADNLGNLTWTEVTMSNNRTAYYASQLEMMGMPLFDTANITTQNMIQYGTDFTWAYQNQSSWAVNSIVLTRLAGVLPSNSLGIITNTGDYNNAEAFKSAMANKYLVYELATPTTETADPYTNPQWVSNWGTEQFVDERDVPVPVGHDSRYPKNDNYKLANIPAPPGGAGDYIVHTDEYGESVYQQAVTSVIGDGTWTSATTSDGVVTVSHIGGSGSTGAAGPTATTATLAWNTVSNVSVPYFTYDETGHISGSSAVSMGIKLPANPNSNTVSTLCGDYTYLKTGADVGVKRNSLIARDSEGYYQSFTSGSGTASSKAINRTTYFDISKIFYYGGTTNIAVNTDMSTRSLYYAVANIDLRYSLNIATTTLTVRKPVYLIFDKTASTVGADGATCYKVAGTATNDWFTQTLPTSADGNIYVEIGRGVRDYRNDLTIHQTYYEYTDSLHEYDSLAALEQNEKIPEILDIVITDNNGTLSCNKTFSEISLWLDQDGHYVDDIKARLSVISADVIEYEAKNVWYNYNNTANMGCIYLYFDCGLIGLVQYQGADNIQYINIANNLQLAHAEGIQTTASGSGSHAEGFSTYANNMASHAEGDATTASGVYSHAEGNVTLASRSYAHSEGYATTASGDASHSEGYATTASGDASHTEGRNTQASGDYSHAEGSYTTASGSCSHAEGGGTLASGESSHAEGGGTVASDESAHAEGFYTSAASTAAHAEGYQTTASSTAAHAEGYQTTASGKYAHAEGQATSAAGTWSHTEGWRTTAAGDGGHAEGVSCLSTDSWSHAEGQDTTASAEFAHAEGNSSIASGKSSHAEGDHTTASGHYSHAEGHSTYALASYTHAEGYQTTANSTYSHAEGMCTNAVNYYSHAGGYYTIANKNYQTAIGTFNATVNDALFIVGKGSATNRSNAMYVTTAGNINCVSVTQTSDRRLKDNITNISTTDLAIYDKLQPKSFTLKSDDVKSKHYGFIAQDVLQSFEELGLPSSYVGIIHQDQNEQGYYNINYTEFIALLVEKQKIMQQEIDELKAAVAALKQH